MPTQPDPQPSRRIDPSLIQAYQQTQYWVDAAPPWRLEIGQSSENLLSLYQLHQTNCAAYLTAHNPRSEALTDAANHERHLMLLRELASLNVAVMEGEGKSSTGDWPVERSVLVMGLDATATQRLGTQFDQNAVLWCGADGVPALMLLR